MDFSKFSDENFDVKEWVNSALRIKDERTPVDVSAAQRLYTTCNFSIAHDQLLPLRVCFTRSLLEGGKISRSMKQAYKG